MISDTPVFCPISGVTDKIAWPSEIEEDCVQKLLETVRFIFLKPDEDKSPFHALYCIHVRSCRKLLLENCPVLKCTSWRFLIGHLANCFHYYCGVCKLFRKKADIEVLRLFVRNPLMNAELRYRLEILGISETAFH